MTSCVKSHQNFANRNERPAFARHSLITICICLIGRYQTSARPRAVRAVVESRRQIKIYQPRHKSRMKSRQLQLIRPLIYPLCLPFPFAIALLRSSDSPRPRLSRQDPSLPFCSRESATKTSLRSGEVSVCNGSLSAIPSLCPCSTSPSICPFRADRYRPHP